MALSSQDRLDIHELLTRYADIIDEREFSRTSEVFTGDGRYDVTDFDMGLIIGADAIADLWRESDSHPLAHHVTDVVITEDSEGMVRVRSKIIGVGAGGRVGSAFYRDVVVETPEGWRITERIVALRSPDRIPEPS